MSADQHTSSSTSGVLHLDGTCQSGGPTPADCGSPGLDVGNNAGDADETMHADTLREAMVAELREMEAIRSDQVAEAFRTMPRHLFAPGAPLDAVYAPTTSVVTKWDEHGVATGSVSAPEIQAFMLEQAAIAPGMNVLEIGSGGYNAALMAELVGSEGTVTTVDIDPEVTDRARTLLDAAGYSRVNVVLVDAEDGVPEHAPYDRIIVTAGAWDIPPAWVGQLADGGRIVVPLRMRGLTRSLALEREGDHLVSRSAMVCGFVKMQGAGAYQERLLLLRGEEIGLRFDDGGPDDSHVLDGVLGTERAEVWSGVTVGRMEPFDTLHFWLATSLAGFCLLAVDADHGSGLVDPGNRWFTLAAVDGDSFAYLVSRPTEEGVVEFGVHAFGPHASTAAEAMAEQVRVWDRDQRGGPGPDFAVWPKSTSEERLPEGLVIDKRHSRVTISWPVTAESDATGQGVPQHPDKEGE
jgi:protein-L-isoaspartate(D-aspartate) O-methyltransferase